MERSKPAAEIYTDEDQQADRQDSQQDQLSAVQEFVQDQNHCCLCGTRLTFSHKMDHLNLTVVEDAKCETCHISLRTRNHSLQ